jgi:hypothetical protein
MEWTQFIIFFIGIFGLFIWIRTESRNDARHMDIKLDANRELIRELMGAISLEMKDFHGRLCAAEEKNRK